jgi:hypothetical protein
MSGDKLVFDLANEVEDVPNVFVRKDWINILDNQNSNYNSNQSVIDTSQLSNSNKYMSYREGYLAVPLLLTLTSGVGVGALINSASNSANFVMGLKNWFGSIIHSLTLDFNGTTVIQQTPFINMYNSFKLMTSLSWQDVCDMGPTMGFYPDDPLSWTFSAITGDGIAVPFVYPLSGAGVANNTNMRPPFNGLGPRVGRQISTGTTTAGQGAQIANDNQFLSGLGNEGFIKRQLYINYDGDASCGSGTFDATVLSNTASNALWKSRIIQKVASTGAVQGVLQIAVTSFIHLRHIHSFFNQIPLIKGAFMKLTLNLNNCSTNFSVMNNAGGNGYRVNSVSNAVGGINPIMLASRARLAVGTTSAGADANVLNFLNGGAVLNTTAATGVVIDTTVDYIASLSVGGRCLNSAQTGIGPNVIQSPLSSSIQLYVPSYSFNSIFEQAYISSPIKTVMYEDIYQYQVLNVGAGNGQINNLLTNGIANLRSVLILPFYSASVAANLCATGVPCYQSPFENSGTGPTSPLCILNNFNVVVSGQNAIYNTIRYGFETYLNQVAGVNSVNAGLTDGLSSGLINQQGWEMGYCYHYVDVSRMLPVEQQVPKSVQVIGQNTSVRALDLFCFLSYGVMLQFDCVSGARV